MGAWSHEPFGNDTANDWAYDLEDVDDLSVIEAALDNALQADEYLDASDAEEAVAAVEVLAKILGKGTQNDSYTKKIDEWIKSISVKPDKTLLDKAQQTLSRILGADSELRELWEEGDAKEWLDSIAALQKAIG